jgi:hypothetical protein
VSEGGRKNEREKERERDERKVKEIYIKKGYTKK